MVVRDVMTANPVAIEPDTTLEEATRLMRERKFRHLPVLRGGKLVGIVTWTDLMRAAPSPATSLSVWEIPALLAKAHVADVMTREVITVGPNTLVEDAAYLLRKHKIGALPVTDQGSLVGIVTESDLFDALIYLRGGDIAGVHLSVNLHNGVEDLVSLARALQPLFDGSERIALSVRLNGSVRRADLRIATDSPLLLAEHLAAAGLEVSHLRFEPAVRDDKTRVGQN
ncbi:MAG: CBS domain-containing protein [Armatimonadota bacterium]|nr:CBS domain-containing protein [Armatimonadota bacterium]MDR5697134.1 CBS domain-containing protein [Armatimonadota bacterium]